MMLDGAELDFNAVAAMSTLMCEVHFFSDAECFLMHCFFTFIMLYGYALSLVLLRFLRVF